MLKIFLHILIILIVIWATTYGWRPSKKYILDLSRAEKETAKNVKETVEHIVASFGIRNYAYYENLERTADYLIKRFEDIRYKPEVMSYEIHGQKYRNIIATLPSSSPDHEKIIIGAHYDSCFNPGANDNASGIAAVLELARLLKDEKTKTNITFIAFVNEEPPFFMTDSMGSRQYAMKAKKKGEKIKAAIIFDLIGFYKNERFSQKYLPLTGPFYPNQANFAAFIGNFPSRHVVSKLISGFKKYSEFPVESLIAPSFMPGVNFSDHWSFWKEGYPAIFITDTAYLRSPHYHKKTDLPDILDYGKMAVIIHGLKKSIAQFANE